MKKQFLIMMMITVLLATVFVAGCTGGTKNVTSTSAVTSNATTSKVTRTLTSTSAASIPTASEFSDMWVRFHLNDTLVMPFTKSVNERDHVAFAGVTRGPYSHGDETNIFELCADKIDAQQTYQLLVNQALQLGYTFDSRDMNTIQDKSTMVGWIPSDKAFVNTTIIGWNVPDDYGIGYYVQTIEMLSPNT
ncbi:MAG TPA: hypothetical protein VEG44_00050 [Candidatus Acidoferrales bacterium]|nr:hypothetical protein [Candidatus Acidoferrales bacterium]